MAISVSGTTGTALSTRLTAPDAVHVDSGTARGHMVDADGQHISWHLVADGPGIGPNGARAPILQISIGGQQGLSVLRLTQQNSNDFLPSLANHANNGAIS